MSKIRKYISLYLSGDDLKMFEEITAHVTKMHKDAIFPMPAPSPSDVLKRAINHYWVYVQKNGKEI